MTDRTHPTKPTKPEPPVEPNNEPGLPPPPPDGGNQDEQIMASCEGLRNAIQMGHGETAMPWNFSPVGDMAAIS